MMTSTSERDAGEWILVVDDDAGLRDLIVRALERSGHATRGVSGGKEALEWIAVDAPRLLLLEHRLPDMTGQELIGALAERGLNVPFVMVTGHGDEQLAVEMMKRGAADYLVKDAELIGRLPAVVEQVCQSNGTKTRLGEAEKAPREKEERYRNLFNVATEGIYRIDFDPPVPIDLPQSELVQRLARNAIVQEANECLARRHGVGVSDMIGRPATDFAPNYGERALRVLRSPNFRVSDHETEDVDAAGQAVLLLENLTGAVEDGRLMHIWGMQRDISERKLAEEALRQQKEQLTEVADMLPGVIFQFYARDDGAMGIYYLSRRARDLCGLPDDTGDLFQWLTSHVDELDRANFIDSIERAVRAQAPWNFEGRFTKPSGEQVWLQGLSRPVRRDVELVYNGVLFDITERKRAEESLRQSEARFRSIIAVSNTGGWEYHLKTDYLWCSSEYFTMLGRDPGNYARDGRANLAENWLDLLHPDDRDRAGRHFAEYLENGSVGLYENYFRLRHADGSWVWILSRGQTLRNPDGSLTDVTVGTHINVTDNRRVEEALKASEMRFEGILRDVSTVAVQGYGLDGTVRYWNSASETFYGYSADEALGRNLLDLIIPPAMRDEVRAAIRQVAETSESIPAAELQLMRKDGSVIPVYSSHVMVRVPGQDAELFCIDIDLSGRKRAEEALRASEERHRSLFTEMQEGFALHEIICDADGRPCDYRYLEVNPAFERATGIPRERWVGHTVREVLPDVEDYWIQSFGSVALTGKAGTFENYVRELDQYFDVVAYCPKAGQFAVVALNVTERKRMEQVLRRNEERLRETARIARVGGWAIDFSDNTLSWTEETFQIHEMDTDRLPSVAEAIQFYHPEDQPKVAEAVRQAIAGGQSFDFEARLFTARKNPLWVRAIGTAVYREGRPVGVQGMIQDITERKRAEEEKERLLAQLLQSQKMESVGRLAGGVAHDFNNMLQAILGNAALALEGLPPASPLWENLQEIQACAQRSADLTRQLLAFARKQTIAPRTLNLNETVAGMLKMLRRLIGEDIDLVWAPGADLGLVNMDPTQVDQILANLSVNARDAIGSKVGRVSIETANVAIDEVFLAERPEARVGRFVRLSVSDNGCGMSQDVKDHLFEPFYTTKELGQGTGLGLPTVYGIVKQNGGFINVYSEPGRGTTVQVYLPHCTAPPVVPGEPAAAFDLARGHETILLVEDEPSILRVSRRALEKLGYQVLAARTPGEAMRLAREHEGGIHLLLTDVVMPEMNGRDLARNLLSKYPNLKRLFMSGYTANVIAYHGVLDPGVHFLQKPFSVQVLADKVREALQG